MDEIFDMIKSERERQDRMWGIQNHDPYKWITILAEELGEASEWALKSRKLSYKSELVQIAAVAVAAIESLNRQENEYHDPI